MGLIQQRAQGAMEYLLIMGAAILVVAIVILATTGVLSGGQSQVSSSEEVATQGIDILEEKMGNTVLKQGQTVTLFSQDKEELEIIAEEASPGSGTQVAQAPAGSGYTGYTVTIIVEQRTVIQAASPVSTEPEEEPEESIFDAYPDTLPGRISRALAGGASGLNDANRFYKDLNYGGYIDSNTGKVWLAKEAFGRGAKFCYSAYCNALIQCKDGSFAKPDLNALPQCTPGCNTLSQGNCDANGGAMHDDWLPAAVAQMGDLGKLQDMYACGWLCQYWGTDSIKDFSSAGGWGCGGIMCSCGGYGCTCNEYNEFYTCYR